MAYLRALAAVLALASVDCRADRERPCPAGFTEDAARATSLIAMLAHVPEGAAITARLPTGDALPICFGRVRTSSITTGGVVLLDRGLGGAEAAARLGHLLLHRIDGLPIADAGGAPCEAEVAAALTKEARAFSVELRLRRALGVSTPRLAYPFEALYWESAETNREVVVRDYLVAHPDGEPGIDGLASAYARRCREGR